MNQLFLWSYQSHQICFKIHEQLFWVMLSCISTERNQSFQHSNGTFWKNKLWSGLDLFCGGCRMDWTGDVAWPLVPPFRYHTTGIGTTAKEWQMWDKADQLFCYHYELNWSKSSIWIRIWRIPLCVIPKPNLSKSEINLKQTHKPNQEKTHNLNTQTWKRTTQRLSGVRTCQRSVGKVLRLAALPLPIDDTEIHFDRMRHRRVFIGRHLHKQHVLQDSGPLKLNYCILFTVTKAEI